MAVFPRLHLFEINDEPWLPSIIRERVQEWLTLFWTMKIPLLQAASPASVVCSTMEEVLGSRRDGFAFVDFCAGAGGPTPFIERRFNESLRRQAPFVLTDIEPHVSAWRAASAGSSNLFFIPDAVDATKPPRNMLENAKSTRASPADLAQGAHQRQIFRMFFLSFHHMPDKAAGNILRSALEAPDCAGLGVFELQGRSFGELLMISLLGPLLWLLAPVYFWQDPVMLLFTYIIPIIPFVVVFDGIVSCLRTRTSAEILQLIEKGGASCEGWELRHGHALHTFPFGYLHWFILIRVK